MKASKFVERLCDVQFQNVFNPYSDRCAVHDREDAPHLRAALLESILSKASECPIDSLWLGRDLGYRGGRRTGLALTDDIHINAHLARWAVETQRPTHGSPVAERTAAVVWQMLRKIDSSIFLWNLFPLHPHEPNAPFTNRNHNAAERAVGEVLLMDLIRILRPRRIVAIGNDAAKAVRRITPNSIVCAVRHPSYGGQTEFVRQVSVLYGVPDAGQPSLL